MNKIDALNQVAEFHKTFNAPILDSPQIPTQNRCDLRVELLAEELQELKDAIADYNIIEIADALCDLQYVLSGAVLEFGLGDKFVELFDEVQRSNMSKACVTREEALLTIEHYKKKDGTESHIEEKDGKFIVYRTIDNKILKSINYSSAKIADVLFNVDGPIIDDVEEVKQTEPKHIRDAKFTPEIPIKQAEPQTGGPKNGLGNVY